MPKSKLTRYFIYFAFTVLVYWRFIRRLNFGLTNLEHLGIGIVFPFLVCAFSFAYINKETYRIHPLKLGLSLITTTGIYVLVNYLALWFYMKVLLSLIVPQANDIVAELAIRWTADIVIHTIVIGLGMFLFYALLRFSAKKSVLKTFPCKKGAVILLLILTAVAKFIETICIPFPAAANLIPIADFATRKGYRFYSLATFLLDAVMTASIFIVAIYTDIRTSASKN